MITSLNSWRTSPSRPKVLLSQAGAGPSRLDGDCGTMHGDDLLSKMGLQEILQREPEQALLSPGPELHLGSDLPLSDSGI